jgi:hypothetical protein
LLFAFNSLKAQSTGDFKTAPLSPGEDPAVFIGWGNQSAGKWLEWTGTQWVNNNSSPLGIIGFSVFIERRVQYNLNYLDLYGQKKIQVQNDGILNFEPAGPIRSLAQSGTYFDFVSLNSGLFRFQNLPGNRLQYSGRGLRFVVDGGEMEINANVESSVEMTFLVRNGGKLTINGDVTNSGNLTIDVASGGEFVINGNLTNSGNINQLLVSGENSRFMIGNDFTNSGFAGTNERQNSITAKEGGEISVLGQTLNSGTMYLKAEEDGLVSLGPLTFAGRGVLKVDEGGIMSIDGTLTLGIPQEINDSNVPGRIRDWGFLRFIKAENGTITISGDLIVNPYSSVQVGATDEPLLGRLVIVGGLVIRKQAEVLVNDRLTVFEDVMAPYEWDDTPIVYLFRSDYEAGAEVPNPPVVVLGGSGCQYWQGPREIGICLEGQPLPVELLAFDALAAALAVELSWSTATELNNDFFTLERSADGIQFDVIAAVPGSGTTNGTSQYKYTDQSPLLGMAYYRLSQTDYDGTHEVLGVRAVNFLPSETAFSMYPNPLQDGRLTLRAAGIEEGRVAEFSIRDLSGRVVYSFSFNPSQPYLNEELEVGGRLARGFYLAELQQAGRRFTQKLVVD